MPKHFDFPFQFRHIHMDKVEVKYMVNGCGKKIPSTRTVVITRDGKIIYEERTQEDIKEILKKLGSNRETST